MNGWLKSWRWGREYFRHVRPEVIKGLKPIRARAHQIPNAELREQAVTSLDTKQFHCEGGGVFASPFRDPHNLLLSFLLPYQTLCDFLDTVTDRGPSQDPQNLRLLHQSLLDALTPENPLTDYYALHPTRGDGGYIEWLVLSAREALARFPGLAAVQEELRRLASLYIDLQVFKHGPVAERVPHLTEWAQQSLPAMDWWEFSAAAGSTLGLFALLNLAAEHRPAPELVRQTNALYFPWMGALHILLDYFVDQEEDRLGGDLNFIAYYPSADHALAGLRRIYRRVMREAAGLADGSFHQFVANGLLGFYLSDQKVRGQPDARRLLRAGGPVSLGIYLAALNGRAP